MDSDGNAPSPAGCKPAVLPFITTSPLKIGGRDGCCPRYLLPDKKASLLFFFTTMKWTQGWELHPSSPAYETGQSSGSPCILKLGRWSACDDTTYPPNLWRGDPLSCRAWHMRSMKRVRRHGNAPCGA